MSTDTDRSLAERMANVEGTVEQMDKRLDDFRAHVDGQFGTVDNRFDSLDSRMDALDAKIERNRREMRRLLLVLFAAMSLVVAIVQVAL